MKYFLPSSPVFSLQSPIGILLRADQVGLESDVFGSSIGRSRHVCLEFASLVLLDAACTQGHL
jgi:hypothetical protein